MRVCWGVRRFGFKFVFLFDSRLGGRRLVIFVLSFILSFVFFFFVRKRL